MDCLVSVDCFWHSDRFYSMNPSDSGACDIFLYSDIFFNFFKNYKFLSYKCFICFIRVTPKYFILFEAIVMDTISWISFSVCHLYIGGLLMFLWVNFVSSYCAEVLMSYRSFPVEILGSLKYIIMWSANKDDEFFLSNFCTLDVIQ